MQTDTVARLDDMYAVALVNAMHNMKREYREFQLRPIADMDQYHRERSRLKYALQCYKENTGVRVDVSVN